MAKSREFKEEGLLLNRYYILRLLGKGGMGSVYLARDTFWDDSLIALKTINRGIFRKDSEAALSQFKNEYDIMTRLEHPNLIMVKTLEFDKVKNSYYIIMEYFEGTTLNELMKSKGQYSAGEAVNIIIPLLRALGFIHSRNIVYRDVKPHNIIINGNGIKLADFGLSNFINIDDRMIRGSVYYMAPEALKGDTDQRTDIYSLGILFYTLLTGKHLIKDKVLSKCISVLGDEESYNSVCSASLNEVNDDGIRDIIAGMIAHKKSGRYNYCSDIIKDLNELCGLDHEYETEATREAYVSTSEFIGRKREFRKLISFLNCRKDHAGLCIVRGSQGVGKTRLLSEFKKYCILNDIEYFESECIESVEVAYYPLIQIINQILMRAEASLIDKYGEFLINLTPYNKILSDMNFNPSQKPGYNKETLNDILINFFLEYSDNQKNRVIFCLNDFHNSDSNTRELIRLLQKRISNDDKYKNLKIVMSIRGIGKSVLRDISGDVTDSGSIVSIKPFTPGETRDYIHSVFGIRHIDRTIYSSVPLITDIVRGNPLYLKEFLRMLIMDKIINRSASGWKIERPINDVYMPNNMIELFENKIRLLSLNYSEQRLLNLLGLIDIGLDINQIKALSDSFIPSSISVRAFLTKMEKNNIIQSFKKEHGIYFVISYKLIRKIISGSAENRSKMHSYIGERFEEIFKNQIHDYLDIIAYHYSNSDRIQKAIYYLKKAGDKARKSFNFKKALQLYEKALSLLGDNEPDERIYLLLKKSVSLEFIGKTDDSFKINNYCLEQSIRLKNDHMTALSRKHLASNYRRFGEAENAINELKKALDFFLLKADKINISEIYCELGTNYHYLAEYEQAMEYYRKYKNIAEETGNQKEYSNALGNIGNTYWSKGEFNKALYHYNKQREIAIEIGDKLSYGYATGNMGSILFYAGDHEKAYDFFEQKKKICKEMGDRRGYGHILGNMGVFYYCKEEYKQAMECFKNQNRICKEIGDKRGFGNSIGNIGNVYYCLGKDKKAMQCYKEKRDICLEIGNKNGYSNATGNMGSIFFREGDYKKAMECYEEQRNICMEIGDRSGYSCSTGNIGNIYENTGDFGKALQCYQDKKEICEKICDKKGISNAAGNMAAVYQELDDSENALLFINDSIAIARKEGIKDQLASSLYTKSEILLSKGNHTDAERLCSEALNILKKLKNEELLFSLKILMARIKAVYDKDNAIKLLYSILIKKNTEEQNAEIYYELWKLTEEARFREKSLSLYHLLLEKVPKYDYKKKLGLLIKEPR